ncbi:MAG: DUF2726 domain-containing protein [Burkholderiales bacterium]|nr:DUF2726 domain-containing protein [Burkholderiales bacterium]
MSALEILGLAAVLLGLGTWLWVGRGRQGHRPTAAIDTVAGSPATTRPLNAAERRTYRLLLRSVPQHYIVMPQVAIARFVNVSRRTSYRAWYDKIGHRCVDFLVCNPDGEAVVVVELDELEGIKPSYGRVVQRKARVLAAAQVPILHWVSTDLPSAAAVREQLMRIEHGDDVQARQARSQPSGMTPLAPKGATLPAPLTPENEEFNRRWSDPVAARSGHSAADDEDTDFQFSDLQRRDIERNLSRRAADPWGNAV